MGNRMGKLIRNKAIDISRVRMVCDGHVCVERIECVMCIKCVELDTLHLIH